MRRERSGEVGGGGKRAHAAGLGRAGRSKDRKTEYCSRTLIVVRISQKTKLSDWSILFGAHGKVYINTTVVLRLLRLAPPLPPHFRPSCVSPSPYVSAVEQVLSLPPPLQTSESPGNPASVIRALYER